MRRLLGCFSTLLLIGAILMILLVRGPGLKGLPTPAWLEPPLDVLGQKIEAGSAPEPRPPFSNEVTPPVQPPTERPPLPTATATRPSPTPMPGEITLVVGVSGPAGEPLDAIIDGNAVTLTAHISNTTETAIAGTVSFFLTPPASDGVPVASCAIRIEAHGQSICTARAVADGWAWQDMPSDGAETPQRVERRTVYARLTGRQLPRPGGAAAEDGCCEAVKVIAMAEVPVQPKPVVLVHGFTSSAATWSAWTGPHGFLARWGIPGYAVGDGRFAIEPLDTGVFTQPRRPTKSIAENAEIVARYVDAVRKATGAERVDLVAHSMGGLISRYYISHLMPMVERPGLPPTPAVNQLHMIGTPNAGTPCAIPPAMLGLYPPATTQLTPAYVQHLFNPQASNPRGVPFFVLAGDPVRDFAALVCTPVPTDVFVSVASAAGAIPAAADTMPVRHGEQTRSPAVFSAVLRGLSRGPSGYPIPLPTAPAIAPPDAASLQIGLIHSGILPPNRPATLGVTVDEAEAVSFLLYAPGQDVELSILSNVGRRITADTARSTPGMSAAMADGRGGTATQGLHIEKPAAGRWQLILTPRAGTQTDGAFYAVAVFLQSDLRLTVETPSLVVPAGQPTPIYATLRGPAALETVRATAEVRTPQGDVVGEVPLFDDGTHGDEQAGDGIFSGLWTPAGSGLYNVVAAVSGRNEAGSPFQRLGLLAIQIR